MIAAEIIFILLLVVANGIFAMAEIAIVSSRKARLRARSDNGDRKARVALELAENPDDFLSTVQIGITLVGIIAGVFGGATLAEQLGAHLNTFSWIAPHGEKLGLAVVVLTITYLSLVIGELVPKRVALTNPEGIGSFMGPFMRKVSRLARPAVWLLSASTTFVVRALRIPESKEPTVTEEEVTSMVALGRTTGEFHIAEEEMIKGVFELSDRSARTIMTPRHEVVWLDLNQPHAELMRVVVASGLSRFPVAEGNLDHVIGVVEVKDVFAKLIAGDSPDLRSLVHEPLVFPETTSALHILHEFRRKKGELGLVIDEHGGVEGIVTTFDLATRVLGLDDEPELVQREDGSWLVDGGMHFDTFASRVGFRATEQDHDTVAGFVLSHLRRVPKTSEHFDQGGFRFEIVDIDGRRIDKVLVTKLG